MSINYEPMLFVSICAILGLILTPRFCRYILTAWGLYALGWFLMLALVLLG